MIVGKILSDAKSFSKFVECRTFCNFFFEKTLENMPKVTKKKSKRQTTTEDHSEVVAAVKRQHDEYKKDEACDLLQDNLNRRKRIIEESLAEYDSAVWDPEAHSICNITKAHNVVWALNPAIYRDAYMLQKIRHDPTIKYTTFDMGSDGKCRRVSIDGDVCQILILLSFLSKILALTQTFLFCRCRPMKSNLITRQLTAIMLLLKQDIRISFRNSVVKRISANTKIKLPIWFGKPNVKSLKRFVKLNSMVKCHENDARKPLQPLEVRRSQKRCLLINFHKLGMQGQVPLSYELVVNCQNAMLIMSLTPSILPNDCVYD